MPFTVTSNVTTTQTLTGITDLGVITSSGSLVTSSTAVSVTGGGLLVNDGLIASVSFLVNATANFSLMNSGVMTTRNLGLNLNVTGSTATTTVITNTGDIASTGSTAISCGDAGLRLQNSGLISGLVFAIQISGTDLTVRSLINNSGVIEQLETSAPVISCLSELRLVNTGTILGRVFLGAGDDVVDTRAGTITGDIELRDGNNLFRGGALGERVEAGIGNDTVDGGAGDDQIISGAGNDVIRGGAGDDQIVAQADNDEVRGGEGNDTIIGGGGRDALHGGGGADVFVFQIVSDSATGEVADVIEDFDRNADLIDLQFVETGTAFVDRGALLGGGTASFGYERSGNSAVVLFDQNGDGTADFHLVIANTRTLTVDDFLI
jgi:Ca2+-binding RTX toxin-like protein